jgi:hypothetical protein
MSDTRSADLIGYQMLSDGQWVDAADGAHFEGFDPSNRQAWSIYNYTRPKTICMNMSDLLLANPFTPR